LRIHPLFILTALVLTTSLACSKDADNRNPISPATPGNNIQFEQGNSPLLWGYYEIRVADEDNFIVTPLRHASFALNAVGFLNSQPPKVGVEVVSVYPGGTSTSFGLNISITHPFAGFTKYAGFDVMGIVMGDGSEVHPGDPELRYYGIGDVMLVNEDGFTRWMNCPEFSGTTMPMLGFIPGDLGTPGYNPTATLNPYKYFADGLGASDDLDYFLGTTFLNRGVFLPGSTNTRYYHIRFPHSTNFSFQYAVLANWEQNVNSPGPPDNIPDDFPPEANVTESITIKPYNVQTDAWYDGSTGGGNYSTILRVFNWNAEPEMGYMNDYIISLYSDLWEGPFVVNNHIWASGINFHDFEIDVPVDPESYFPCDVWVSISHPGVTYANPFGVPTLADDAILTAHFRDFLGINPGPPTVSWDPPTDHDPRFLFIHHSTGSGFLYEGGMWDLLEDAGFEVHDRTYGDGWVGDNTNPEHWPITFTDHYDDMISWELEDGEYYDIVAFKSCFPASYIDSEQKLEDYMEYYNTVKSVITTHYETLFIPFTFPPLTPDCTQPDYAERAREFAFWLKAEFDNEYNMVTYDVFDILAGDDPLSGDYNCLKYEYTDSPSDSHPNAAANEVVAEHFTTWLTGVVWE